MRKNVIGMIAATVGLGLIALIHPIQRHYESKKVERIPQVVAEVEQTQEKVRDYFSDNIITSEEGNDLYWICRNPFDSGTMRDSQHLTTNEGARINKEFFDMRYDFRSEAMKVSINDVNGKKYEITVYGKDVSNSDLGGRLDKLFTDYTTYLQTKEYTNLIKPLNVKERLVRHLASFSLD